ncbi:putative phage tail assembly chaperone [Pasteurella multocida]|uniref:putative phage tail assembly chaperone n=1 Tax=Pasteurella multocida TaxID=747 RepID=UPI002020B7F0|nr:putative phage tail assembly chaperone [Pasteurella multocida]MCL7832927.1 putative phage tail assembly chaperone [Pasteurella multocida]
MEKTQAQTLLEKLNAGVKDSVIVNVAGVDFKFNRDNAAYDTMINEVDSGNKVTPIKDYLLAIIEPSQKDDFLQVINVAGLAIQVAAAVNKVLVPKIEVTVKN